MYLDDDEGGDDEQETKMDWWSRSRAMRWSSQNLEMEESVFRV